MNEFWKSFRTTLLVVGIVGLVLFLEGAIAKPRFFYWVGAVLVSYTFLLGVVLAKDGTRLGKKIAPQLLGFAAAMFIFEIPLYYLGWM